MGENQLQDAPRKELLLDVPAEVEPSRHPHREWEWRLYLKRHLPSERKIIKVMRTFFEGQRDRLLAAAGKLSDEQLRGRIPRLLNKEEENEKLKKVLSPAVKEVLGRFGQLAMDRLRKLLRTSTEDTAYDDEWIGHKQKLLKLGEFAFDLSDPVVIEWLKTHAGTNIVHINDTTWALTLRRIRRELAVGLDAGESTALLRNRIRDSIKGIHTMNRNVRARTIARTEVTGASNVGTLTGFKQSDVVESKEWLSAGDGDVRDEDFSHVDADGEIVQLGKEFKETGEAMEYPGDQGGSPGNVINCRCTMNPILKSTAGE